MEERLRLTRGTTGGRGSGKRSEYVYQACVNCRKRKVKCSGGETCTECSKIGDICVYTEQRRKKKSCRHENVRNSVPDAGVDLAMATEGPDRMMHMDARLLELEAHCSWLQTFVSSSGHNKQDNINVEAGQQEPAAMHVRSPQGDIESDIPANAGEESNEPPTAMSPVQSGENLEDRRSFGEGPASLDMGAAAILDSLARSEAVSIVPPMAGSSGVDLLQAEHQVCHNNGASFRPALDVYFRLLNPLQPITNENEFRAQFDEFVFCGGRGMDDLGRSQFLAMLLLIQAEVKMLTAPSSDPEMGCGWEEFCAAETILANILWKSTTNLQTIECLLMKARYTLYLQRLHQARDTMSIIVRICLQLRLHHQPSWAATGLDPFRVVMRQRIFWSIFILDRCVSLSCGMLQTLPISECMVNLPPAIDDRSLFPDQPLPQETPELSCIPYLWAAITWGKTWDEVWEKLYSVRACFTLSKETIATLDAEILRRLTEVSPQLHWQADWDAFSSGEWAEPWLWRQRMLHTMRLNALRLLVRQEFVSKATLSNEFADEIVTISATMMAYMKTYMKINPHNVDRYFLTVYLSSLLVPVAWVVLGSDIAETVRKTAAAIWGEAAPLLEEISRTFNMARLMRQRLRGVTDTVNSVLSLPSMNILPGSIDQRDGPRTASRNDTQHGGSSAPMGTHNVAHDSVATQGNTAHFMTTQFQGFASDPDLWRVATW